jgi:hypothetical protein
MLLLPKDTSLQEAASAGSPSPQAAHTNCLTAAALAAPLAAAAAVTAAKQLVDAVVAAAAAAAVAALPLQRHLQWAVSSAVRHE